jgi:hypothetical protein
MCVEFVLDCTAPLSIMLKLVCRKQNQEPFVAYARCSDEQSRLSSSVLSVPFLTKEVNDIRYYG